MRTEAERAFGGLVRKNKGTKPVSKIGSYDREGPRAGEYYYLKFELDFLAWPRVGGLSRRLHIVENQKGDLLTKRL